MFLEYQKRYNYFIDLGCKQPILTNQLGCCVERELAWLKRHFVSVSIILKNQMFFYGLTRGIYYGFLSTNSSTFQVYVVFSTK